MSSHFNSSLNSLNHGAAAESLFIPGEDPADFEALLQQAFAEHQPSSDQHSAFLYDSVHARWMLARRQRTTAAYELDLHKQMPDPTHWSNESLARLNLFDRYPTMTSKPAPQKTPFLRFSEPRWCRAGILAGGPPFRWPLPLAGAQPRSEIPGQPDRRRLCIQQRRSTQT